MKIQENLIKRFREKLKNAGFGPQTKSFPQKNGFSQFVFIEPYPLAKKSKIVMMVKLMDGWTELNS